MYYIDGKVVAPLSSLDVAAAVAVTAAASGFGARNERWSLFMRGCA